MNQNKMRKEYWRLRKSIGTQEEVASILSITRETISNRETGKNTIKPESFLAMRYVAEAWDGTKKDERLFTLL